MKCEGVYSSQAEIAIHASKRDGMVGLIINATVRDRVGDRVSEEVYCDRLTDTQARFIADWLRQLVYGDIGDFDLAGLTFAAGEYSGVEIGLPYGRTVWLAEDSDALILADELDKEGSA